MADTGPGAGGAGLVVAEAESAAQPVGLTGYLQSVSWHSRRDKRPLNEDFDFIDEIMGKHFHKSNRLNMMVCIYRASVDNLTWHLMKHSFKLNSPNSLVSPYPILSSLEGLRPPRANLRSTFPLSSSEQQTVGRSEPGHQ